VARTRDFFTTNKEGVRLFLRASPGAAKDEVAGLRRGADGEARLAVKVTAAPDKGKANAAIIKLLAKEIGLPKSALRVTAGDTSRLKSIMIAGDPAAITAALELLAGEKK